MLMMGTSIECDECKQLMRTEQAKVQDVLIGNDRRKRVWNCIHCNHEYLITVTDGATRTLADAIEADAIQLQSISKKAEYLVNRNRMTKLDMKRNLTKTERIGNRMKANRKKLDEQSKVLVDEHNKEMQQE